MEVIVSEFRKWEIFKRNTIFFIYISIQFTASVSNTDSCPPRVHCRELSEPVPGHLQANHVIYRTEPGVLVNSREPIGCGANSQDMVSVALKIKLDTSKKDLISDEIVKVGKETV